MKPAGSLPWATVLAAFAWRVYHLGYQSLWRDEVDAIRFARWPLPQLLATFARPGWNGPLYFFLLRHWVALARDGEFAVRFFSLLFGVLNVPLACALGRKLHSPCVGLLAGLLAAFSPYLVWYSQEAKMYSLITLLSLLSTYLYLTALERGGWGRWAAYVAVTSLCFYTHLLAALIVPTQAILFLAWWPRYRARWKAWLAALGCLTLPYLPLARWEVPLLLSPFETGHRFYPLGTILSVLFLAFSLGVAPWQSLLPLGLFAFVFLAGAVLDWGDLSERRGVATLLLYLFVPVVGLYLISLGMPIFADRYLIYVAPAFYLLLARGLTAVGRRSKVLFAGCLALLLLFDARSLWTQAHTRIKSDFRAAASYFAAHRGSDDVVIFLIPYARHTFEYYYRGDYSWADGPYTNGGMSEEEVAAILEEMTAGHRAVWLVASEEELWDERGLVKGWLDANADLVAEVEFARVRLYRYLLNTTTADAQGDSCLWPLQTGEEFTAESAEFAELPLRAQRPLR